MTATALRALDRTDLIWRNGPKLRQLAPGAAELRAPAVVLINPKYPHNVGAVVRAACCFGIGTVLYTGDRVGLHQTDARLPREERMRDYADVDLIQYNRPFDVLRGTPVAVEFRDNAELLPQIEHPSDAIYVFGAEDGALTRPILQQCHMFVKIPTRHCLNLSIAVAMVLYDRMLKESSHDQP